MFLIQSELEKFSKYVDYVYLFERGPVDICTTKTLTSLEAFDVL